jgi:hypothetical protein
MRTLEQTITCKAPNGDLTEITSVIGPFQATPGSTVPVAGLQCPDGDRLVEVERVIKTPGAPDVEMPPLQVPPELDVIPATCFTAGVGCHLDLQKRTQEGTWTSNIPESLEWTNVANNPEDYRCRMGDPPAVDWVPVPLRFCKATFRIPDPNVPGGTRIEPQPSETPIADTSPIPTPTPGTGDCDLGWTDLFTGAVFVKGSKCVLAWAFVPDADFLADVGGQWSSSFSGTDVGAWIAPVAAIFLAFDPTGTPGDCLGPVWHIPIATSGQDADFTPFSICNEPQVSMSVWTRTLSTIGILLVGVLAAARWVLRSFGIGVPKAEPEQLELF